MTASGITAQEITAQLGGKWNGSQGNASCPCHDDRHKSFRIADGDKGGIIFRCWAGCEPKIIIAELRRLSLWPDQAAAERPRPQRRAPPRPPGLITLSADAEADAVMVREAVAEQTTAANGTVVETYLRNGRSPSRFRLTSGSFGPPRWSPFSVSSTA